jgi:hypothetical protein
VCVLCRFLNLNIFVFIYSQSEAFCESLTVKVQGISFSLLGMTITTNLAAVAYCNRN